MSFPEPKNLNSTNVEWIISEKTTLIVKNYSYVGTPKEKSLVLDKCFMFL
jgi:hypothetical protein